MILFTAKNVSIFDMIFSKEILKISNKIEIFLIVQTTKFFLIHSARLRVSWKSIVANLIYLYIYVISVFLSNQHSIG